MFDVYYLSGIVNKEEDFGYGRYQSFYWKRLVGNLPNVRDVRIWIKEAAERQLLDTITTRLVVSVCEYTNNIGKMVEDGDHRFLGIEGGAYVAHQYKERTWLWPSSVQRELGLKVVEN